MSFSEINENTQSKNISMSRFIYCNNILVSIINTYIEKDIYNKLTNILNMIQKVSYQIDSLETRIVTHDTSELLC